MRVSVWWDIGWQRTRDHLEAHLEALRDLGISRVCVMVNQPADKVFGMRSFPADGCRAFAAALKGTGVALTLTTWCRPTQAYMDALGETLPPLAAELGAGIELDLEGLWTEEAARKEGWPSLEVAERYLLGCLRPTPTGVRLGATAAYVRPQLSIARHMDEVALQCYSYCDPPDPARAWDGWAGPGRYQDLGERLLARDLGGCGWHVVGLAAFRQAYPGYSAAEAMAAAWDAIDGVIPEVRYWSWSHIAGLDGRKRGAAYKFLKEKAAEGA